MLHARDDVVLHDSFEDRATHALEANPDGTLKRLPPPSMSGLVGFLTENGSWGTGLAHLGVFSDDRIRYLGGLFYNRLNLDFYGAGGDFQLPIDRVSYTLNGIVFIQQVLSRVADSDVFIGVNYKYLSFDTELDLNLGIQPPDWFPELRKKILSYLEEKEVGFNEYELVWPEQTEFKTHVLETVHEIPYGETLSYAEVARLAGHPGAARAVGNVMASNPFPLIIPCHRVLAAGKRIGGYSTPRGIGMKEQLLQMENVNWRE